MGTAFCTTRLFSMLLLLSALTLCASAWSTPAADRAAASYHAAYRTGRVSYRAPNGKMRRLQAFYWYPSLQRARLYRYGKEGAQLGYVRKQGKIAPGRHPLIVFSHGLGGTADQTIFLMEDLARAGYIVAAVHHADSLALKQDPSTSSPNLLNPGSWTDASYVDRKEDLSALLDDLLDTGKRGRSPFRKHIDPNKVGAAGHSLGGYTVLGMTGGWDSWRDRRIKAALLLSPYTLPYHDEDLSDATPAMLQGGTLDFGITPFLPELYGKLPVPKYFLVLKNAWHFEWTNLVSVGKTTVQATQDGNPKLIVQYSIAFFDQHLRGLDQSALLEKPNDKLDSYRFKAND